MAFLGMRGNGDWTTNQRPENWRQKMLFLYPNGDLPLTAMMSMMGNESTDDPKFHWWEKSLATQAGAVANVYTDILSTAYTTGGAAGDTLYVKVTAAVLGQIRPGHQVLLRNTANYADDCNSKVVAITANGDSSYLTVKLLEADPTTTGIADCNYLLIVGNVNPEGGSMPQAIAYDPTEYYNLTQIFRTSVSMTRTAMKTRLRTGDQRKEAKREAFELHGVEMEKSAIWGVRSSNTGDNGKPERTSGGLIKNITGNGGVVSDFSLDSDYDGETWLGAGEDWLDVKIEEIFRYGGQERMAFCGSGVILAINKLVKEYGNYNLTDTMTSYGLAVKTWSTPFGKIHFKIHPLLSYEATNSNTAVIFDLQDIKYRYIDDTKFYDDPDKKNTGRNRIDGSDEEWLTEAGYEFHHASKCGYLNGFGTDNPL